LGFAISGGRSKPWPSVAGKKEARARRAVAPRPATPPEAGGPEDVPDGLARFRRSRRSGPVLGPGIIGRLDERDGHNAASNARPMAAVSPRATAAHDHDDRN